VSSWSSSVHGLPAAGRRRQPSNQILDDELDQLRTWATVVPLIFLSVSAFLVNVVLSRLVHLQRPEIATLKALGYGNGEIGLHYFKLVAVVVLLGAAIGVGAGAWLGNRLTGVYAEIFRFPLFRYQLGVRVPLLDPRARSSATGTPGPCISRTAGGRTPARYNSDAETKPKPRS
jgi:putative ABC transport system permease protein